MNPGAVLDIALWIAEYATYLESNGYAGRRIGFRLTHLSCLNRFIQARGLQTLEPFGPELACDFIDYWSRHHPKSQKRRGFLSKSRFEPHHNQDVQFSLRSFLRWAHATGRLQHNAFPLTPPVRGGYFFPETAEYLRFCEQHKGLAKNSWKQVELFVRRFDHFLHSAGLASWNF